MIFAQYLDNYLKDFDETWSEVRQNRYKSDGLRYLGYYQTKSIKIDLNLWMIQCSHIQFSGVHVSSLVILYFLRTCSAMVVKISDINKK